MLCRGRVPQLGEEPGLPAHVSAEGLKLCVCVCVCVPAMLCHDRAYQGEEQGLSTPVSVEGWHVVYLLSCVMAGYPKEGSWAYPHVLYLLSCVMAGYPKEGSWPTHAFCTCCLVP